MSVTHKITYTHNRGVGTDLKVASPVEGEGEIRIPFAVPANAANFEVSLAFELVNLKSVMITASAELTLKTNSTSEPGNTFILDSDRPLVWNNKSHCANPFDASVTTTYWVNPDAENAVDIEILVLLDVTL